MPMNTWDPYNRSPEAHFARFESFHFSNLHRSFLRFLPKPGGICLDVGAGSGRDAFAMAKRGLSVVAVEPNMALFSLAKNQHRHEKLTWVNDSLPLLKKIIHQGGKYDFILLSAVWMHLHPVKRNKALLTLSSLLSKGGYLAITLRIGEADLDRSIFEVTAKDLLNRCAKANLNPVYIGRKIKDSLNRPGIHWIKIVLTRTSY